MACARPTTLTVLPAELLLLISDFLSPADIACLAVCTHGLMALFASEESSTFNGRLTKGLPGDMEDERSLFLARLSLDSPEYYLCSACLSLHRWSKVSSPAKFEPLKCFSSLDVDQNEDRWLVQGLAGLYYPAWCRYQLQFTHVYLAMRRFYRGMQYGLSTDSLFHTEVRVDRLRNNSTPQSPNATLTPEEKHLNENMTSLTSIEARVCPTAPSLCLRIQGLAVVRRHNESMLFPKGNTVWVCGHITNATPNFSERVRTHILAYSLGTPKAAEYGKCSKCNTEWHIELRDLGTHDVSLVFTRWLDVGPGLSPEDPRWRSLLLHQNEHEVDPDDVIFSPRLRFESSLVEGGTKHTMSDEELYLRNVSFLEEKRYMAAGGPTAAGSSRPESRRRRSSGCSIM